eukprot:2725496-Rhodomonas_salina.1
MGAYNTGQVLSRPNQSPKRPCPLHSVPGTRVFAFDFAAPNQRRKRPCPVQSVPVTRVFAFDFAAPCAWLRATAYARAFPNPRP